MCKHIPYPTLVIIELKWKTSNKPEARPNLNNPVPISSTNRLQQVSGICIIVRTWHEFHVSSGICAHAKDHVSPVSCSRHSVTKSIPRTSLLFA